MIMILKRSSMIIAGIILVLCIADAFLLKSVRTAPIPALTALERTVVIDAGHGYPDGGANTADGTLESDLNLAIAKKLVPLLEQSGCKVIMTRTDENGIQDENAKTIREKKKSDMQRRKEIRDTSGADLFISIHQNYFEQSKYYGAQVMYDTKNPYAKTLATCVQKQLRNVLDQNNKRVEAPAHKDKYLTQSPDVATIIVECGFMSNPNELALLKTDTYQDQVAWAIYLGVVNFYDQNTSH